MRRAAHKGYGLALLMVFFASTFIFAMTIQLMNNSSGLLSSIQGNTISSSITTVALNAVRQDIINQLQAGNTITTAYRYPSSGTINVTTPKNPASLTGQDPNNATGLTDVIGSYYATITYAKNDMYLVKVTTTVGDATRIFTQPMALKVNTDPPYPMALLGNTLSYTGTVVIGVGDVDKDGYDDFIVGAPDKPGSSATSGEAYLVFGRSNANWTSLMPANGEFQLKTSNTNVNYANRFIRFTGNAHSQLGTSAAGVGDVNNDGYPDFVITAPTDHDFDQTNAFASVTGYSTGPGEVFLILGRSKAAWDTLTSSSLNFTLNSTSATAANTIYRMTESGTNQLGSNVSGLGDVDGDGYADFGVTAKEDAGLAYIIFGRATAGWNTLENTSLATTGTKANNIIRFKPGSSGGYDYLGTTAVCSLGDVDQDGKPDIGIGAMDSQSGYGSFFVVFGRASGTWPSAWQTNGDFTVNATNMTFANGMIEFKGRSSSSAFGQSCGGGSDVDGDGYPDFIIATPNAGGSNYYGEAYLLLGRSRAAWSTLIGGTNPFQLTVANTSWANKIVRFYGNTQYMNVGSSINMLGDVNKDGFADIVIGAWEGGTGNDEGEVNLINGRSTTDWGSIIPSNGDFLLKSSNANWTKANGFSRFIGRNNSDFMAGPEFSNGHQIAPLGDINGDGAADFAMGSPRASSLVGAAYIFFGQSNTGWNSLFSTRDVSLKTIFP